MRDAEPASSLLQIRAFRPTDAIRDGQAVLSPQPANKNHEPNWCHKRAYANKLRAFESRELELFGLLWSAAGRAFRGFRRRERIVFTH